MAGKIDTEVIIGGKVLRLSGYESEDYLQKVAAYINNKIAEFNRVEFYRRSTADTQNILMQINLADDYFKAKKQITILEDEVSGKDKEIYDLKHDLIAAQIKLDNAEKSVKALKKELEEKSKKLLILETELKKN